MARDLINYQIQQLRQQMIATYLMFFQIIEHTVL